MRALTPIWIAFLCGLCQGTAQAEDAPKGVPAPKEERTLEQFGAANPACRQWTDGCAVCLRRDDGTFGCSLPGIACEPSSLTCRQVAQEQKPAVGSTPPKSDSGPK